MNKPYFLLLLALLAMAVWALKTSAKESPESVEAARAPSANARELAARLKTQIHDLRNDLIAGGPKVKDADKEALSFYNKRVAALETDLYGFRADVLSAEAEYDAALDATLNGNNLGHVESLARRARDKRTKLDEVLRERKRIEQQRDLAGTTVSTIRKRIERRESLLQRMSEERIVEANPLFPPPFPDDETPAADLENPFDRAMLLDMARRDPARAKPIIAREDPALYRDLWPLIPPRKMLKSALPFPSNPYSRTKKN